MPKNSRNGKFLLISRLQKARRSRRKFCLILFFYLNLNYEKNSSKKAEKTREMDSRIFKIPAQSLKWKRKTKVENERKIKKFCWFYEGSSKNVFFEKILCFHWAFTRNIKMKSFLIKLSKLPRIPQKFSSGISGRSLCEVIKFMWNCWRFSESFL